jgi:hypothetical protein
MADTKISALPASTTPLAGTEVLPIVQGGTTVKVSVANLTAGRAISATAVTASTGDFIAGTSGKGITDSTGSVALNFTATGATLSSGILAAPTVASSGQQALAASATINTTTFLVTMYALSGTATLTLPASPVVGQTIRIRTQSNEAVISASNNITSLASGAVTNAILPATAGKWADLWWDGGYWNITAAN